MLEISCTPPGDEEGWSVKIGKNDWMRAIVSTADTLVFAVQPLGKEKGELWLVSKTDGRKMETIPVDDTPRWDGLAVAQGNVFMITDTGKVICFK